MIEEVFSGTNQLADVTKLCSPNCNFDCSDTQPKATSQEAELVEEHHELNPTSSVPADATVG